MRFRHGVCECLKRLLLDDEGAERFVAGESEALARCFVARKLRPGRGARQSRLACFRRARVE